MPTTCSKPVSIEVLPGCIFQDFAWEIESLPEEGIITDNTASGGHVHQQLSGNNATCHDTGTVFYGGPDSFNATITVTIAVTGWMPANFVISVFGPGVAEAINLGDPKIPAPGTHVLNYFFDIGFGPQDIIIDVQSNTFGAQSMETTVDAVCD